MATATRKKQIGAGAVFTVAALVAGQSLGASVAYGATASDPSAAQGQILSLDEGIVFDGTLADLGHTLTSYPQTPLLDDGSLDVGVLYNLIDLDLGTLTPLPRC